MKTVSELLCHQECPQRWHFLYGLRRRPKRLFELAPMLGTAFHAAIEEGLKFDKWDIQQPSPTAFTREEDALKYSRQRDTLQYVLNWWKGQRWWDETIAVEQVLTGTVGDVQMRGKVDAVVSHMGGVWAVQFKTRADLNDIADFARWIRMSLHEAVYRSLITENYGPSYMGTILHVFSKEAIHTREKGASCDHCGSNGLRLKQASNLHFSMLLDVNEARVTTATTDITTAAAQLGTHPPERRLSSCLKIGHVCPFFRTGVCDGGSEIEDDDIFEDFDPNERYSEN